MDGIICARAKIKIVYSAELGDECYIKHYSFGSSAIRCSTSLRIIA